jgi:hypothetical protein
MSSVPVRLSGEQSVFGLDDTEYEIDLNAGHGQQLRDTLAVYVNAGRRVSGARPSIRSHRAPRIGERTEDHGCSWMSQGAGYRGKDRGRVPTELMVEFNSATGQ